MNARTQIPVDADGLRVPPHSVEAEQSVLGGPPLFHFLCECVETFFEIRVADHDAKRDCCTADTLRPRKLPQRHGEALASYGWLCVVASAAHH